jgi:hypothetical protein
MKGQLLVGAPTGFMTVIHLVALNCLRFHGTSSRISDVVSLYNFL